jgi:hypothetical protein
LGIFYYFVYFSIVLFVSIKLLFVFKINRQARLALKLHKIVRTQQIEMSKRRLTGQLGKPSTPTTVTSARASATSPRRRGRTTTTTTTTQMSLNLDDDPVLYEEWVCICLINIQYSLL